ncbi:DUF1697 domain-containing protein [Devosia oryziradicis]|uniref:DUF1697 domain-containing protein n=1 Tax=Devosia oryziradicis TaxID=2801335 RepID=A0ABX7C415_9HYPH|nr:DUF1697 domain-containing protein [Devosia oryziradicis]QQR37497.1 DUF1697 domain-containing protein [Devosia oryziradicis]
MTAGNSYLVLLRGINVGGKNKLPMAALRSFLEDLGFENVSTYIQSGNAIVQSDLGAASIASKIEKELVSAFELDSDLVKVLVLGRSQLKAVVDDRPRGFGDEPDKYHSDAIFLMGLSPKEALTAFSPLEGVDTLWPGKGVIYSQRLSAKRTKSRLNRMMASPLYKSMTVRTWGTVTKLLDML